MKHDRIKALLLSAALMLSLTACGGKDAEQGTQTSTVTGVAVQVKTVEEGFIATENQVSGTISADNEATIMVSSTAKCTSVRVHAGETVNAGDIICTLDFGSTLATYSAAKIGYEAAVQSYTDQKNILDRQVALAKDNVDNTKALYEIGAASRLEVDTAEISYQSAVAGRNAALAQLEAGIQSAKSGLEQLNLVMDNVDMEGNVIAPISGTLVTMNAVENSYVSASLPVAVINGPDQMKITASVSEALVSKLHAGSSAEIYVSALDKSFAATVRSVDRAASQMTKLYSVVLTVPSDVTGLLSGMFADVTFHTDGSDHAIVIPTEAVLVSGGTQYVYVVENDTARYVEVTTGLTGNGVTEVVSGLSAGQQLVVVGQAYLSEGTAVRVVGVEG